MPLDKLINNEGLKSHRDKVNSAFDSIDAISAKTTEYDLLKIDFDQLYAPQCRKINFSKPLRFVAIGASIMNGTFGTEARREAFITKLNENGIIVQDVTEYATGGWTSTSILANLSTPLADFAGYEDRTVFIVHAGGNDVSANGPYPSGDTTLASNYEQILTDIIGAGFFAIPCSITYRIPPSSNPSAPYNSNTIVPIMTKYCPESLRMNGRPIVDLYQYTSLTTGIHDPDGIHYTSSGYDALGQYIASKIPEIIETNDASSSFISDIVVDFGDNYTDQKISLIGGGSSSAMSYSRFNDINGKQVSDLNISISGFSDGSNSSGKDYSSSDYSLDNSSLTRDSLFVAHSGFAGHNGELGQINFSGLSIEPSASYELSLVASRNVSEDGLRWGAYTAGGITKELSAADSASIAPNIITFEITGKQLIDDGLKVERRDKELSSFAYINGIRLTKI